MPTIDCSQKPLVFKPGQEIPDEIKQYVDLSKVFSDVHKAGIAPKAHKSIEETGSTIVAEKSDHEEATPRRKKK